MNIIDNDSEQMFSMLEEDMFREMGKYLYPGDERMIFAKTMLLCKSQEYSALNSAARQTWLDYAYGEYLDAMGERYDTPRTKASYAETKLNFYIDNGTYVGYAETSTSTAVFTEFYEKPDKSAALLTDGSSLVEYDTLIYDSDNSTLTVTGIDGGPYTNLKIEVPYAYGSDIIIPEGTQVTGDSRRYFETTHGAILKAGTRSVEVDAIATVPGADYNNIPVGDINTVVDLYNVPLVPDVRNVTVTSGGDDAQSDDVYREVLRIASNKTTTAGPRDSYRYWIMVADSEVIDAIAVSPQDTTEADFPDMSESINYIAGMTGTPGEVFCYAVLKNGELVEENDRHVHQIEHKLKEVRPLTDYVHVMPTRTVSFKIDITCYVAPKDADKEDAIRAAVDDYLMWQQTKFGRDINPDKLRQLVFDAGAQRAKVDFPNAYVEVEPWQVAHCASVTVDGKAVPDVTVTVKKLDDDGEVYIPEEDDPEESNP